MSKFQIMEDVENRVSRNNRKNKLIEIPKCLVVEKKYGPVEKRGVLQPLQNEVRQDSKRLRLSNEEKEEKMVRLDESPKVNAVDETEFNEEILNIANTRKEEPCKENEEQCQTFLVAEYRQDIWQHLRELEQSYGAPKSKYMLKQRHLSWKMRTILVDWLASVTEEYEMSNETFHLSISYIDRFLNHYSVVQTKFQLLGAAAMLLAGKMEEIYPIGLTEWPYLTGNSFTKKQVRKMERLLAGILKFKLQPPTVSTFIEHFCIEHNLDSETRNLARYIGELMLLEGDEYLNHLPSKLAASSVALARYILFKDRPWPKRFEDHCGYSAKQLSPIIQKQQQTFLDSPNKTQQAIQTKYKGQKFDKVALLKPRVLVLEEFDDEEE